MVEEGSDGYKSVYGENGMIVKEGSTVSVTTKDGGYVSATKTTNEDGGTTVNSSNGGAVAILPQ